MQSTGQTSTQAVSFVSIQGSVMMNGMLASLRNVRDGVYVSGHSGPAAGPDRSAFWTRTGELYRETSRGQLRVAPGGVRTREQTPKGSERTRAVDRSARLGAAAAPDCHSQGTADEYERRRLRHGGRAGRAGNDPELATILV